MTDQEVVHAPDLPTLIDSTAALAISRSLHADLNLKGVLTRFHTCVAALTTVSKVRYCNEGIDFGVGEETSHHASYQPELKDVSDTPPGKFHFYAPVPIDAKMKALLEELLSLAARAFDNAFIHHKAISGTGAPEQKKDTERKYHDALVVARLNGLDQLRTQGGSNLAEKVQTTIKERLAENLRDADATLDVDHDHIALILPCTTEAGASQVAKKLNGLIATMDFLDPVQQSNLSISTGVSTTKEGDTASDILAQAKQKLLPVSENQPSVVH